MVRKAESKVKLVIAFVLEVGWCRIALVVPAAATARGTIGTLLYACIAITQCRNASVGPGQQ